MEGERRFIFALARDLGQPVYILEKMPSSELTEWITLYSMEAEARQKKEEEEAKAQAFADMINRK